MESSQKEKHNFCDIIVLLPGLLFFFAKVNYECFNVSSNIIFAYVILFCSVFVDSSARFWLD